MSRLELQKSCAIAKMTAQCAIYMGALKIFGTPWLRPRLLFSKFYGILFQWYSSYRPPIHTYYSSISTRLPEILDCSFQWGLRSPILGKGGRRGSGWYRSKERWWISIGRPVTFPLSLRVSEILPLLFSSMPLFPNATSNLHQNFPMFPREWVDRLLATKSEGVGTVGLIVGAISFRDFQPVWSQSTNVTDRQTDRRTYGRHAIARPRFALIVGWLSVVFWDYRDTADKSTKFGMMLP